MLDIAKEQIVVKDNLLLCDYETAHWSHFPPISFKHHLNPEKPV